MKAHLLFVLAVIGGGCGGSVQPRPLKYHLQGEHLASVEPAKQQAAMTAKSQHEMALLERNKIKSDLAAIDLELLKATNDVKAKALAVESARAEDKAAAATADTGRKQRATEALRMAALEHEVAEARREHVAARKKAKEGQLRWAEFNVYAAEAKFELEKAAVAVGSSIAPSGFKYGDYETQHAQRVAEATQAKADAEQAQRRVEDTRRALEEKERELGGARL